MTQLKDLFPYQTPVVGKSCSGWKSTTGNFRSNMFVINGGVTILSRYEITEQRQHIYHAMHGSTWDSWANKGIAYARINVKGTSIHILGTHLQADEGHVPHSESHDIRMTQIREMKQFLHDDLKLSNTERVIVAGDLNVEYTTEAFRKDLESNVRTTIFYEHGMPGSFSPSHNRMAWANARANRQPEDRNETLDYILVPKDFAPPFRDPMAVVVPLKSSDSWYWKYLAKECSEKKGMTSDLSDHYPVMATIEFAL